MKSRKTQVLQKKKAGAARQSNEAFEKADRLATLSFAAHCGWSRKWRVCGTPPLRSLQVSAQSFFLVLWSSSAVGNPHLPPEPPFRNPSKTPTKGLLRFTPWSAQAKWQNLLVPGDPKASCLWT